MDKKLARVVESKKAHRRELAAKPIAEKLRIVEELAMRSQAIRASSNAKAMHSARGSAKDSKQK